MIPVIIPKYQGDEVLPRCIDALNQSTHQPIEIFVRDNDIENILWTKAINEGLRKWAFNPDIQYILILNQDAIVKPSTITELIKCMESKPDIGICCPIQINPQTHSVYWGGSFDAFPFGVHQCMPLECYQKDFETYWANGAAMLLRTEMIREIGLFDENMEFICSDSDYSFTARSRGWQVTVAHKAHAFHSAGQSGSGANEFINTRKLRDTLYFARKWLTGDVYRQLSYEGSKITHLRAKSHVEQLQNGLPKN